MAATGQTIVRNYKPGTGGDRYARFCADVLAMDRTEVFDAIAESLEQNKQTLVVGGNGLGKSYGTSGLAIAVLYTNPDVVVPVTAGNGDTVKNSIWKNIKSLWRNAPLFGDYKDNDRSLHTELDDKWFLECHSPKNPEDLEGDHNANVVYIIEEAEKPGVTGQHIDSARSTLAEDDHILVLCNPPTDEGNIVYELEQRDSWNVLRFPTWESRNARADRGLTDAPKIGGLSGVGKMRDDWAEYHDEEWPGIETVIEWSSPYLTADGESTVRESEADRENPEFRDDLHEKWYKRRAGIMPPQGAETWRPWSVGDVREAAGRTSASRQVKPDTFGIDVARSGDKTVLTALRDDELAPIDAWQGTDHVTQTTEIKRQISDQHTKTQQIAVDSTPMGSHLTDELDQAFPGVRAFNAGAEAADSDSYRDQWAEGLALLGEFLASGGVIVGTELREELFAAARTLEFSERHLKSRGGKVIEATSKEEIAEILGHSPDYLDSALMAVWARETDATDQHQRAQQATISF